MESARAADWHRRAATAGDGRKTAKPAPVTLPSSNSKPPRAAIYFMFYNWIRIHKTLRVTPAMAAGLTDKTMDWEDVFAMIDNRELQSRVDAAERSN